jgi:uncharacterized coiled-coil protein SlyX
LNNTTKERENIMTQMTIIINGLEYVAKTETPTVEDLLNQIKSLEAQSAHDANTMLNLDSYIKELEQTIDQQVGEIQGLSVRLQLLEAEKDSIINDLEGQITDLEEEVELNLCRFSELEEALEDIKYITERL